MATVTKSFVSDYGAPTDGTSNASAALDLWLADAATIVAAGNVPKLMMGGHAYHMPASNGPTNGLKNAIIDGEGATVDALFLGSAQVLRQNFANSARIATTTVGATSATIIQGPYFNDVQTTTAFLSVGQWVMFSGVSMQTGSYPPNFQYNEFRKLTGIVGNVISWAEPLVYAYLQTWPLADTQPVTVTSATPAVVTMANHGFSADEAVRLSFDVGGSIPTGITRFSTYFVLATGLTANTFSISTSRGGAAINTSSTGSNVLLHTGDYDLAGPATVYGMHDVFDGEHQYSNLTGVMTGAVFGGGVRSIVLDNVDFTGLGACPSLAQSWVHRNSQIGEQNEVDKCVEYCLYQNCTGTGSAQLYFQSPGIMQCDISDCTLKTLNGTPLNLTINNSSITETSGNNGIIAGATNFGRTDTITLDGTTVATARIGGTALALATFSGWSFSAGVFSFPVTRGVTKNEAIRCFVPGHRYIVGYGSGRNTTPDSGSGPIVFTVLSIYQDATTFYIGTDLVSATFPTYGGGNAASNFFSYGAKTITQNASGPADVTQFQAPSRAFALHLA